MAPLSRFHKMGRGMHGLKRWLVVALATLVTACAGGGEEASGPTPASGMCFRTTIQNCGPGPWDPFGIALSLAWISGQCTKEVLCANEPVQSDFDEGIVTDDFIARNWTTANAVEREPNDSVSEAMPFVLRANSGVLITGAVNDSTDLADFVALSFSPDVSANGYTVYLCRALDSCILPWYEGDAIYVDLLDQNQVVVQTTRMTAAGYLSFQGTPGVLYYIAVRASNTNGSDFQYKLVITD
jgi:hypothetical protein